jgi:hypothetical protein
MPPQMPPQVPPQAAPQGLPPMPPPRTGFVPPAQQKADLERVKVEQEKRKAVETADASIAVLDKAIAHPGRKVATGLSGVLDPRNLIPGTNARDFQVILDQIRGKAFLQAFESLKGGGQITEVEGKKATEAIARLNTAQSDDEFLQALNELRGVLVNARQALVSGASVAPARGGPQPGMVQDGYRFKGGNPADPSSWEKM